MCKNSVDATYHSVVGQKLLLVDWKRYYPNLALLCPTCGGDLKQHRTNFSQNKTLFPIFGLDGPPAWAMVMAYTCQGTCKRKVAANDGDLLCSLPDHIYDLYPVEAKYARGNLHIAKTATEVFAKIMVTYTNGELCSKLIYNAINNSYKDRVKSYYAHCEDMRKKPQPYPKKNGEFIVKWPPKGQQIRTLYREAAVSPWSPWKISDKNRNEREIIGVKCDSAMANDHTMDVVKNYKKGMGAFALWDVATETGEIATAVLVKNTKTEEYAHAAEQLLQRTAFAPKAMYSDTWPAKDDFWGSLFGVDIGRLGLFHYICRITKTLRQTHIDFHRAMTDLLNCLYEYHGPDYEKLIEALKNGTLNGKAHSEEDILDLQKTKKFRERYSKYLRKKIRHAETIRINLHQWFCKYKCSASEGASPAEG
jgi:hypothetical protein